MKAANRVRAHRLGQDGLTESVYVRLRQARFKQISTTPLTARYCINRQIYDVQIIWHTYFSFRFYFVSEFTGALWHPQSWWVEAGKFFSTLQWIVMKLGNSYSSHVRQLLDQQHQRRRFLVQKIRISLFDNVWRYTQWPTVRLQKSGCWRQVVVVQSSFML